MKKVGVALATLALLATAACGTSDTTADAGTSAGKDAAKNAGKSGGAAKKITRDDLPSCPEAKAAMGAYAADMVVPRDDTSGPYQDKGGFGLTCTWVTPETLSGKPEDFAKIGTLGLTIAVERHPLSRAVHEKSGLVHRVPEVEQAGGYVYSLAKDFRVDGPLTATGGPHVIIGNVTVFTTASGLFLRRTDNTARTNREAIDAGLKLQDLLRR